MSISSGSNNRVQDKPSSKESFQAELKTGDFDELAHALRNWDAEFRQLSRGSFHGELQTVAAGNVQVMRVAFDRVVQARGIIKPGHFGFSLIAPSNEASLWRGRQLRPGQINVNRPVDVMNLRTSPKFEVLLVVVETDWLRKNAEVIYGIDLDEHLKPGFIQNIGPARFTALESTIRLILGQINRSPAQAHLREDIMAREQTCVRRLLQALITSDPDTQIGVGVHSHQRVVVRAEEFMHSHLNQPLMTENLCKELEVSERTLRYAFRDVFGQGPMAYFKTQKLNAVRQALKKAKSKGVSVHEIASQWGFEHTGNLAADYYRLFGERPSETLGK